jgi:hypothetical protein
MSRERHRERVREVRDRLARDGPPWTRDRAGDFDVVTVPERDCDALRDLLIAEGVETVVEVGLAYGSSALAIGEALVSVGAQRPLHVIIDPFQATDWSNVGWQMLQSAGLDAIARLVLQPSSMALPQPVVPGALRRRHDRSGDRTHTPPGAPPPRPFVRAGIRALPAVLMPARPGEVVVASARAAPPPW